MPWRSLPRSEVLLLTLLIVAFPGCSPTPGDSVPEKDLSANQIAEVATGISLDRYRSESQPASLSVAHPKFRDVAGETGLDFAFQNGATGKRLMVEATGCGCAWSDFDRDGWCDLFCVQGGISDLSDRTEQPTDRLFHNRDGRFLDVTNSSEIEGREYGQGVTVGDYDNDGFDDIFVTNVGRNTLWHNSGDGTFERVADWTGTMSSVWSSSAAWADIDLDGDLDLYVGNYCDFDPLNPVECRNPEGTPAQCQPREVPSVPDEVFVNNGDGKFREAAAELGLSGPDNRTLGLVVADFFQTGVPDIYVANDATANFLFVRQPDGTYEDQALRMGCAFDSHGRGQASMGVAVGDFDRNGLFDLYLTHFEGEWNTLYSNGGSSRGFVDVTGDVGLLVPTIPWVGFGTVMTDFDLNGTSDLFVVNGHIDDLGRQGVLSMPPQLFTYDGKDWQEVSESAGEYFNRRLVGRGCAEADFDNDGDMDIAVIHQNETLSLLETESSGNHWLGIELVGCHSNRLGLGALVTVTCGDISLVQQMTPGGSYCSCRQSRLVFGVGDRTEKCQVEVAWPQQSGPTQVMENVTLDQRLVIVESHARAAEPAE